jgi:hypothetical protein
MNPQKHETPKSERVIVPSSPCEWSESDAYPVAMPTAV